MTNRRKHAFATVVAVAAALGTGSVLAMAQSNQSYGSNTSAQSATAEESSEVSQPQAMDSSQSMTIQSQDDESSMPDEAVGSDDSDNSAMDSDTADSDSDMATGPNTARAYGPSAPPASTVEGAAATDEVASATTPAPVYESVPAYIAPPDSPRYTPETGDAIYGSKLDPVGPQSNRFNDATGQ